MRQKTKNHRNQGSNEKKNYFLDQSPSRLPRWVHVVRKTRAKNSHAWAPLRILCQQTKKLPIPSARWIFIPPLAICFLIANTCTKWRCHFEGQPQHGGWADFAKNFRPSLFNNDLSNEPNWAGSISLDCIVEAQFTFILYIKRILLWRQRCMKPVFHKWRNPPVCFT